MKTFFALLILTSQNVYAGNEVLRHRPSSTTAFLADPDVSIDKPVWSQWIPLIRKYVDISGYRSYGGGTNYPTSVSCGALQVYDPSGLDYGEEGYSDYVDNPNELATSHCFFSPITIDFKTREIIAYVDVSDAHSVPYARNVQAISGKPTVFAEALQNYTTTGDSKIDSLAKMLSRLSNLDTSYGQSRHEEGLLFMRSIDSSVKIDPLKRGISLGGNLKTYGHTDIQIRAITERSQPVVAYESTKQVVAKLSKTIDVLWSGYEQLKLESNRENQELFSKLIAENAAEMSKELKATMVLLRTKRFHPMELILVVNRLSDLIEAVDRIMKDEEGQGPGFIEIIQAT